MNTDKIQTLTESFGFDTPEDMVKTYICDGLCPCICMSPECDYTDELEPDQDVGWCPECKKNSMKSAFILMGIL